jgi:putative ABC transport system permease protein
MFLKDLRYAIRMLRRTPLFTFAAVLTLALGIGVTTAIFIVVNTEMLRALPFGHPSRLVWVAEKNDKLKLPVWAASVLNHLSWKEQTKTVDSLSLIGFGSFNLTGRSDPEQIPGSTISPSLFSLLEIHPIYLDHTVVGFARASPRPRSLCWPMAMCGLL